MEQQHNNKRPVYPGAVPMLRIDGGKIRLLREQKGLTQLYLSTVVGVTTDTISRWENRHYQSIKQENAEKLAQALDVSLEEILEEEQAAADGPVPPGQQSSPPAPRRRLIIVCLAGLVVMAGLSLYFFLFPGQKGTEISARRTLPPHVPPGRTFPVLIRVTSPPARPVSLIVKEDLPKKCEFVQGLPEVTSVDRQDHSLKWISRTAPGSSLYAYMCRVEAAAATGDRLVFSGTVTAKDTGQDREPVDGSGSLEVAPFHWADTNRDSLIDDEEILAVYDLYSDIRKLDFDRDLIDSIWAGRGYAWDDEQQRYQVLE